MQQLFDPLAYPARNLPTKRRERSLAHQTHSRPTKEIRLPIIKDFFLPKYSACTPPMKDPTNAPTTDILAIMKCYAELYPCNTDQLKTEF